MHLPLVAMPLGLAVLLASVAGAQDFDERFEDWPVDLKINGRVIVAGQLSSVATLEPLLPPSKANRRLVLACPHDQKTRLVEQYEQLFETVELIENPGRIPGSALSKSSHSSGIDEPGFDVLAWHVSPYFSTAYHYLDQYAEPLRAWVDAGRTVILVGPNAEWASRYFLVGDRPHPSIQPGCELLPDCVLKVNYEQARSGLDHQNRLLSVLASQSHCVGIGLDSETALLLSGRKLLVAGQGTARLIVRGNAWEPHKVVRLVERSSRDQAIKSWLADLTQFRREAMDRELERFPSLTPSAPVVPSGTLFIVGGGGLPKGLMDQFVEAAGGEQARLVYVPCSEDNQVSSNQRLVQQWQSMGVQQATFIHTKNRIQADQDQEFLQPLRDATGIWFGGGRQWNFADSYYGTTAHRLMKDVLARGGVIGGSSAGASIQARYLARATPIQNFDLMAPGYERGGLGFISGVAIDQHFTQRDRQKDMTQLVDRYPQLLGIGIDEQTALIVQGSVGRIVGRGKVHFYDRRLPVLPDQPDFTALPAGTSYNLASREVIKE